MTEREHCESVAEDIIRHDFYDSNVGKWRERIAALIIRERAAVRAEVLEEAAALVQDVSCEAPGEECARLIRALKVSS